MGKHLILRSDFLHRVWQEIDVKVCKADCHRPERCFIFPICPIGNNAHISIIIITNHLKITDFSAQKLVLAVFRNGFENVTFLISIAQMQRIPIQHKGWRFFLCFRLIYRCCINMEVVLIIHKEQRIVITGRHHCKGISLIAQQDIIIPVMSFDHGLKQFTLQVPAVG